MISVPLDIACDLGSTGSRGIVRCCGLAVDADRTASTGGAPTRSWSQYVPSVQLLVGKDCDHHIAQATWKAEDH